jgi:hypothetical protein
VARFFLLWITQIGEWGKVEYTVLPVG